MLFLLPKATSIPLANICTLRTCTLIRNSAVTRHSSALQIMGWSWPRTMSSLSPCSFSAYSFTQIRQRLQIRRWTHLWGATIRFSTPTYNSADWKHMKLAASSPWPVTSSQRAHVRTPVSGCPERPQSPPQIEPFLPVSQRTSWCFPWLRKLKWLLLHQHLWNTLILFPSGPKGSFPFLLFKA